METGAGVWINGVYPLSRGEKKPVLITKDVGNGKPFAIGKVDGCNPHAVKRWLEPLVKRLGTSVIITNDLDSLLIGQSGARSPLEKLRSLLIRLNNHWDSYRVFDWQKDVLWTNNDTKQAIGRIKCVREPFVVTKPGQACGLPSCYQDRVWFGNDVF